MRKRTDITKYFEYDFDSYQKGQLNVPVSLQEGPHKLEIRALDNMGNEGKRSINVIVVGNSLILSDVLNYPNPAKDNTYFTFSLNTEAAIKIIIYTITGKVIKTIEANGKGGFNSIYWDCKDNRGDAIANGVYFYKVLATSSDEQEVNFIGKLIMAK